MFKGSVLPLISIYIYKDKIHKEIDQAYINLVTGSTEF